MLALVIYAFIMAAGPILHHDLQCHLKSADHCQACLTQTLASRVEAAPRADTPPVLIDARIDIAGAFFAESVVAFSRQGRAPPRLFSL